MWATKERLSGARDVYEDVRRDAENLAFGTLARADGVRFKRVADRARPWYERAARTRESEFYGLKMRGRHERQDETIKDRYFTRSAKARSKDRNAPLLRKPLVQIERECDAETEYVKLNVDDDDAGAVSRAHQGDMESVSAILMRETKKFNERTRETPEDIKMWIEFARFQDKFMALTKRKTEVTQLVEKKIAILEQALRHHPHDANLIIMLLAEREKVEESITIESRWRYACEQNSGNPAIWRAFIRYRLRDFSNFSASAVRRDYDKALRSLASARNQLPQGASSAQKNTLEVAIVDLVIDACRFDIQSGATERAVAKIQAVLEFGCLSPEDGRAEEDLLDLFESFWECGEPRVGEPNATGWRDWIALNAQTKANIRDVKSDARKLEHEKQESREVPPPPPQAPPLPPGAILGAMIPIPTKTSMSWKRNQTRPPWRFGKKNLTPRQTWRSMMRFSCSLPVRLGDIDSEEVDMSTPQAIWFDDVKDGLIRLKDESVKERLWTHALLLLGTLEVSPGEYEHDDRLDLYECVCGPYANAFRVFESFGENDREVRWLDQSLGFERMWADNEAGRGALGSNMLRVYARSDPTVFACHAVKNKDDAKTLLAGAYENSLKLWAHLAEMEWRAGRKASARKIYSKIFPTAMSARVQDISHLVLSWVECERSVKDRDGDKNALKILMALASADTAEETIPENAQNEDSTSILRAKKCFTEKMMHAFNGGGVWSEELRVGLQAHGVALIRCFAHFLHVSRQSCEEIEHAIRKTPKETQRSRDNATHWHKLHLELLRMKPVVSRRSNLESALRVFPSSPTLLLSLCELELEVHGRQRMRIYFDLEFERRHTVMSVFLALGLEIGKPFGSNPRAIAVLERSLAPSAPTSQSPLLWLTYMRAYLTSGQVSSAKTVFLRAINAVPWNKTLWLHGIESLKDYLTTKERVALLEVMREKKIFLRTDLFEVQMEAVAER
ncbi:NRDE-2, necessary for RNA interference-domain-containing protein [Ostreococcus tauri]|uniref:NRDE-2, necessary for RNA interference-domain-containing protein n=1 Tax=Ostreococcus tauri TaxID=70448 RepID=A0A1Y5I6C9_OSTTA|nr:NRDE-2, necessary for RNA interference-domain-containing protein [Ostreococcus tauri]